MKKIFLKEGRLRKIIVDRNEKVLKLIENGTIRGTCSIKLATKEFRNGLFFGWEITYDESGQKIEVGETQKKPIQPNGTTIPQKDWFKPVKNIGVFKKGG